MPVLHQSHSTNPFFAKQKKENGAAGKKKYGFTPRAKRAEIFLGCTSVSAASRKKVRCYHASHLGVGRGGPNSAQKPPTFFFFCPEIFRFFFFFFRQTAKPGFCGFETAKKHLASALLPTGTFFHHTFHFSLNSNTPPNSSSSSSSSLSPIPQCRVGPACHALSASSPSTAP